MYLSQKHVTTCYFNSKRKVRKKQNDVKKKQYKLLKLEIYMLRMCVFSAHIMSSIVHYCASYSACYGTVYGSSNSFSDFVIGLVLFTFHSNSKVLRPLLTKLQSSCVLVAPPSSIHHETCWCCSCCL